MQALLEVKKGEQPYKAAETEWFCDEDGPVCFRLISKKMKSGQIEMAFYSLRKDGLKRIIQDISFAEDDFYKIVGTLEETMKKFFPDFELQTENIDMAGGSNCRVEKNSRWGKLKLGAISRVECQLNALKTKLKRKK